MACCCHPRIQCYLDRYVNDLDNLQYGRCPWTTSFLLLMPIFYRFLSKSMSKGRKRSILNFSDLGIIRAHFLDESLFVILPRLKRIRKKSIFQFDFSTPSNSVILGNPGRCVCSCKCSKKADSARHRSRVKTTSECYRGVQCSQKDFRDRRYQSSAAFSSVQIHLSRSFLAGCKDALAALPQAVVNKNSMVGAKLDRGGPKKTPAKKGALMIKTMKMLNMKRK